MGSANRSIRSPGSWQTMGAVLLMLIFGYFGSLATGVYARTRPLPQAVPAAPEARFKPVAIESCDDTMLAGWYAPGKNGAAVILLHDEGETRAGVAAEAEQLLAAGYSVLLYDRRGHGESSPVLRAAGWDDLGDVYNAWDWLADRPEVDDRWIGIFGTGTGGQVALRAAAFSRRIYAAAAATDADGPPDLFSRSATAHDALLARGISWRTGIPQPFAVEDVIQDIAPRPVLLIAGKATGNGIAQDYFARAQEPKYLQPATQQPSLARFFDDAHTLTVAEQ